MATESINLRKCKLHQKQIDLQSRSREKNCRHPNDIACIQSALKADNQVAALHLMLLHTLNYKQAACLFYFAVRVVVEFQLLLLLFCSLVAFKSSTMYSFFSRDEVRMKTNRNVCATTRLGSVWFSVGQSERNGTSFDFKMFAHTQIQTHIK